MAIFESTLFHRLRNSLGNVVTYTYCGKGVLRRKPLQIRNPKTPAQQEVRSRFKAAGNLSAYFREIAPLGFPASCLCAGQTGKTPCHRERGRPSSHGGNH